MQQSKLKKAKGLAKGTTGAGLVGATTSATLLPAIAPKLKTATTRKIVAASTLGSMAAKGIANAVRQRKNKS